MPTLTTHLPRSLALLLLLAATACATPTASDPAPDTASEPAADTTADTAATAATTKNNNTDTTQGSSTTTDPPPQTATTDPTSTTTTAATDPVDSSTQTTDSAGTTGTGTTGLDTGDTTDPSSTGGAGELGMLSGECGLIDAMELESPAAFVFTNEIDFGDIGFAEDLLTPGGHAIIDEGNLNEGSIHSEIVAYEVLARCDMATFLKGEGTIVYQNPMGKKTDLLVDLDGYKVGVSVVRAVGFPKDAPYTVMQAQTILTKKLTDIQASTANVAPEDAWIKQILAVVAYEPMHVDSILAAYDGLDPQIRADTILLVTLTNGDDAFIY